MKIQFYKTSCGSTPADNYDAGEVRDVQNQQAIAFIKSGVAKALESLPVERATAPVKDVAETQSAPAPQAKRSKPRKPKA